MGGGTGGGGGVNWSTGGRRSSQLDSSACTAPHQAPVVSRADALFNGADGDERGARFPLKVEVRERRESQRQVHELHFLPGHHAEQLRHVGHLERRDGRTTTLLALFFCSSFFRRHFVFL
jgi:hypothetical protein